MRRPIITCAAVIAAGLAFTAFAFQPEAASTLANTSIITLDPVASAADKASYDSSMILGALTFLAAMALCSVQRAPRRRAFSAPCA